MSDRIFSLPLTCLPGIGEVWGGDYDFPMESWNGRPVILDIGANVGAYSWRALSVWPSAIVHAYEPDPFIFRFLEANCAPRVICHNAAVGDTSMSILYSGNNTPLCSGLYPLGERGLEKTPVTVIDPADLPVADIVKIDAELSEGYILEHLSFTPKMLALEWHGDEQRVRVEAALAGKMILLESRKEAMYGRGILKYIDPSVRKTPP